MVVSVVHALGSYPVYIEPGSLGRLDHFVREHLEELVAMGATHLLLNPIARYAEQVEALAEVAGL